MTTDEPSPLALVPAWSVCLVEPLMSEPRRAALNDAMLAVCRRQPDWAVAWFAGVCADMARSLPANDPWRYLNARAGEMTTIEHSPPLRYLADLRRSGARPAQSIVRDTISTLADSTPSDERGSPSTAPGSRSQASGESQPFPRGRPDTRPPHTSPPAEYAQPPFAHRFNSEPMQFAVALDAALDGLAVATATSAQTVFGPRAGQRFGTYRDEADLVTLVGNDVAQDSAVAALYDGLEPPAAATLAFAALGYRTLAQAIERIYPGTADRWKQPSPGNVASNVVQPAKLTQVVAGTVLYESCVGALRWLIHRRRSHVGPDDGFVTESCFRWISRADRIVLGREWDVSAVETTISAEREHTTRNQQDFD